jgi:hypothetical protein
LHFYPNCLFSFSFRNNLPFFTTFCFWFSFLFLFVLILKSAETFPTTDDATHLKTPKSSGEKFPMKSEVLFLRNYCSSGMFNDYDLFSDYGRLSKSFSYDFEIFFFSIQKISFDIWLVLTRPELISKKIIETDWNFFWTLKNLETRHPDVNERKYFEH